MKISTLAVGFLVTAAAGVCHSGPTFPERYVGKKAGAISSACSVEINTSAQDELPVSARVLSQAAHRPISLELVNEGARVTWEGVRISGPYTYSLKIESNYDGFPTSYTFKQKLEGNPHTIEERCSDLKLQKGAQ